MRACFRSLGTVPARMSDFRVRSKVTHAPIQKPDSAGPLSPHPCHPGKSAPHSETPLSCAPRINQENIFAKIFSLMSVFEVGIRVTLGGAIPRGNPQNRRKSTFSSRPKRGARKKYRIPSKIGGNEIQKVILLFYVDFGRKT